MSSVPLIICTTKITVSAEFTKAATEGKYFPEAKGRFVYFGALRCQSKGHSGLSVRTLMFTKAFNVKIYVLLLRRPTFVSTKVGKIIFCRKQAEPENGIKA